MSIAVIGPGAIGGTVAAWLAQTHAVTVCARTPIDALHVETPDGAIAARPEILTDPAAATPVDWVLIATKTYDAPGAATWLPGLVGPETRVAVLQNGVEHVARFAPFVDAARIVPAIVDIPAERDAPGRIRQRRAGTIVAPEGAEAFAALFQGTIIAASTSADFATVAWRKLALNCAGVVSGLVMKPAAIAHDPDIAALMRGLVAECIAVGRAEGASLDEGLIDDVVRHYREAPPDSVNSLLADRLAGRETEVDARNGVIVRLGERHGIAAPLNALAVTLIKAAR